MARALIDEVWICISYVHATRIQYQLIYKTRHREYIVAIAPHAGRGNLCSGVTSYGQQASGASLIVSWVCNVARCLAYIEWMDIDSIAHYSSY